MTLRLARSFSLFFFFSVSLSLSRVFLLPGPAGPIICTIILSMFTPYYDSHHNDICETEIIGRARLAHNPQTLAVFFVLFSMGLGWWVIINLFSIIQAFRIMSILAVAINSIFHFYMSHDCCPDPNE